LKKPMRLRAEAGACDFNVQARAPRSRWSPPHPRLDVTAIQTVGLKGHDGFLRALVK